jgi:hypothetical protein
LTGVHPAIYGAARRPGARRFTHNRLQLPITLSRHVDCRQIPQIFQSPVESKDVEIVRTRTFKVRQQALGCNELQCVAAACESIYRTIKYLIVAAKRS